MTPAEQSQRACAAVAERIREVAPAGLGRWPHVWTFVAEPADRFLDALRAWEGRDTPESRDGLQRAADTLVRAWRKAGRAWEAIGGPAAVARRETSEERTHR